MGFSNEWDDKYQDNTHMSVWPWTNLVSLVMRNKPQKRNFKVLELGCGGCGLFADRCFFDGRTMICYDCCIVS